jgi:Methyltransferase domain
MVVLAEPPTRPRSRWKWGLFRMLQRSLRALKVDAVVSDYYSPVPRVGDLRPEFWHARLGMAGIPLDIPGQVRFLERVISSYADEYRPPMEPRSGLEDFHLTNPTYGGVDAKVLYGMVRHLKPRRVIELGSGYSSLVIKAAAEKNASEGRSLEHRAYDPFPWLPSPTVPVIVRRAEEVDPSEFRSLEANDVLFVDTTHTVRLGGDVNHVLLEILPSLAGGVVVHFHDIFLPWHYPRQWVEEMQWYWTEQYLLHAFLSFNDQFEVILSLHALARENRSWLLEAFPDCATCDQPSAFWIRRADGAMGAPSAAAA